MSLVAVEGIYKDGKVELAERPSGVADSARVIVTFLPGPVANVPTEAGPPPEDQARLEAGARLLARLKEGIPFGGRPYFNREELYDRFDRSRDG